MVCEVWQTVCGNTKGCSLINNNMGQYTDKINRIAKEFAEIEYYEKVSAIEAYNGKSSSRTTEEKKKLELTGNTKESKERRVKQNTVLL